MALLSSSQNRLMVSLHVLAVALPLLDPVAYGQSSAPPLRPDTSRTGPANLGTRGPAATAPANGSDSAARATTNSMGDPKGNRAAAEKQKVPEQTDRSGAVRKPPMSAKDRQWTRLLAQQHLAEIKMSALATSISTDRAVRGYAEKMLEEHFKALDELKKIAFEYGVILPGGIEKEQASVLHQLALKIGQEYDQLYLSEAALVAHEQSHQLFKEASSRAQTPELKAYANRFVPILGQHLGLAQQMKSDPRNAAAAVQSAFKAAQSLSTNALSGTPSNQTENKSSVRGGASLSRSAAGQGK